MDRLGWIPAFAGMTDRRHPLNRYGVTFLESLLLGELIGPSLHRG
jgi:hypothetical protein